MTREECYFTILVNFNIFSHPQAENEEESSEEEGEESEEETGGEESEIKEESEGEGEEDNLNVLKFKKITDLTEEERKYEKLGFLYSFS